MRVHINIEDFNFYIKNITKENRLSRGKKKVYNKVQSHKHTSADQMDNCFGSHEDESPNGKVTKSD